MVETQKVGLSFNSLIEMSCSVRNFSIEASCPFCFSLLAVLAMAFCPAETLAAVHPNTKVWSVTVDFTDTNNKPENIVLKRAGCDKELSVKILDFWNEVVTKLPSSWEKCSVFDHTSAQSLFPPRNDTPRKPPKAVDTSASSKVVSASSKIAMSISTTAELQALLDAHTKDTGYVVQSKYSKKNGSCLVSCINARQEYKCLTNCDTHTSNNAYLVLSKGHVWYRCQSEKCAKKKWKVDLGEIPASFTEISAETYAERVTRMLSRELLLQGRLRGAVDVLDVLSNTIAILASGDFTAEQKTIIFATFNECIARSDLLFDSTLIPDIDASIATACEIQTKDAAENAFKSLHSRRMANHLLVFKNTLTHKTDESVYRVLKNIDTALTDCRSLVLYTRKMWTDAKHEVFTFICMKYPENALCNEEKFADVWQTKTANMPYARKHLDHYTTNALTSHAFIKSTLPSIMHSPIFSCSQKDDTTLHFTLDAPPLFHGKVPMRAEFTLEYTTGDITGLNRQGCVHNMYGFKVREYFAGAGGVHSMANLLYGENIGSLVRYDSSVESWRLYCATTGIWKLPKVNEDVTVGTTFLKNILLPIESMMQFVGPAKFDWISGVHEADLGKASEESDADSDDADGPVKKKQKRMCKSSPAGEHAMRKLRSAIAFFVESPKHMVETMAQIKALLHAPFEDCCHSDRLACPNGVVNLRNGELLPIAKPDDFFTSACATPYDPTASVEPAEFFFREFFPIEHYTDRDDLVRGQQQWHGYCLTGETRLEKSWWYYGKGSNGKTKIVEMVAYVLGPDIHAEIPMSSMCKARGVNNDALYDARQARHVTISESDKSMKISEAAYRSIVSGEKQCLKTMYKKETSRKSHMKLTAAVNEMPVWQTNDLCSTRRNYQIHMQKLFLDLNDESSKAVIREYRDQGLPACLIVQKDIHFFDNHVKGQQQSFLRFMVLGAVAYYQQNNIELPLATHAGGTSEGLVPQNLEILLGAKTLRPNIHKHF